MTYKPTLDVLLADLRDDYLPCRLLREAAADAITGLQERVTEAVRVLEMCQECIRGETPEDMTDAEAKEYVISKIRDVILA